MGIKTRVIATLRGRKDKPASIVVFGCVNAKCHPATIRRGEDGKKYECVSCHCFLRPILVINSKPNERATVSAQNISEGASFVFVTRFFISTGKKKREKYFFHKGALQQIH